MYDNTLKVANEYFLEEYDFESDGDKTSDSLYLGGSQGGIEVQVLVTSDIKVDVLTIKLQDSDDDSSFSDLETLVDIDGTDKTESEGTLLARFTLPQNCDPYVRVDLSHTDASGGGTKGEVSVYPAYVAR